MGGWMMDEAWWCLFENLQWTQNFYWVLLNLVYKLIVVWILVLVCKLPEYLRERISLIWNSSDSRYWYPMYCASRSLLLTFRRIQYVMHWKSFLVLQQFNIFTFWLEESFSVNGIITLFSSLCSPACLHYRCEESPTSNPLQTREGMSIRRMILGKWSDVIEVKEKKNNFQEI